MPRHPMPHHWPSESSSDSSPPSSVHSHHGTREKVKEVIDHFFHRFHRRRRTTSTSSTSPKPTSRSRAHSLVAPTAAPVGPHMVSFNSTRTGSGRSSKSGSKRTSVFRRFSVSSGESRRSTQSEHSDASLMQRVAHVEPTPELTRYSPPTTIQYDAPPSTSILPEMIPLPASPSDELELSESTVLVPSQTETTVVPEPSDSTIPVPEPELTESTVLVPTPAPDADVLTQEEVSLASLSPPLPPVHGPAADADVDRLDLDLASASESESEEEGPRTPPLAATFAHAAEFMRVLVHDEEHEHDDEGGVRVPFVKSEESKLVVVPTPTIVTAPTPTVAVAPTPTLAPIPSTTTTTSTKATPAPAPTPTQPEQPTLAQRLLENARPLGYGLTALCYGLTWYLVTQTPAALV